MKILTPEELYDFLIKRKKIHSLFELKTLPNASNVYLDLEHDLERLHQETDDKLHSRLIANDFEQFTKNQLFDLGFRKWNSENRWLIPIWILVYLNKYESMVCIDGTVTSLSDNIDEDTRDGVVAYYFVIEPLDA